MKRKAEGFPSSAATAGHFVNWRDGRLLSQTLRRKRLSLRLKEVHGVLFSGANYVFLYYDLRK